MNSIPMTQEGYNKIKAEVEHMESVEMPEILERLATARSEGDLKENAEYHGARESQGLLQARINELKGKLSHATIIDTSAMPQDEIRFGAKITIKRQGGRGQQVYTLVGAGEENYDEGKILVTSPLAQGFLGKRKGETVQIEVPAGLAEFTVLDIAYE